MLLIACDADLPTTDRIHGVGEHDADDDKSGYGIKIISVDGVEYLTNNDGGIIRHTPLDSSDNTIYHEGDWDYVINLNRDKIEVRTDHGREIIYLNPGELDEFIARDNL